MPQLHEQASRLPASPAHPRSVQRKGVTTWAPLWTEGWPASRASRAGSTMVRGIMYSSLEWSKRPLTFTGLYSRFFSSIGLQGRGERGGPEAQPGSQVWREDAPSHGAANPKTLWPQKQEAQGASARQRGSVL